MVGTFREILAKETVGVFIGAALPRTVWVAKVDRQSGFDLKLDVLRHLSTLVPGQ